MTKNNGARDSATHLARAPVSLGQPNTNASISELQGKILDVPLWLWPNVLSLDAAFIAALWNTFLAHLLRLHAGLAEPFILALSVWIIYILDHVLDSRGAAPVYAEPIRKRFYRQHAKLMLVVAGGAIVIAAVLAALTLPSAIFRLGIAIALAASIYLGRLHTTPVQGRRMWPREAVVGLLFSVGTVLPLAFVINARVPVVVASGSLLFLPVWANCCAVEVIDWHRAGRNWIVSPHSTAIFVSKHLTEFAGLVLLVAMYLAYAGRVPVPFAAATIVSSFAMAFAVSQTNPFSPDIRSLLVDAAFCSPLLIPLALWNHA